MQTTLLTITQEMATDLLDNNPRNRPLRKSHVAFLCNELRSGRWKFNGDTIRIDTDGCLIDGQHRLEAVRLTGISIKVFLINGLDPDAFDTIDTGAKRSASDTLAVAGENNTAMLAAALLVVENILAGKTDFSRSNKMSNAEIVNILDKHSGIRNSIHWGTSLRRLAPPSISIAMHYIFSLSQPQKADQFFHAIATGENLAIGNPAYLLRQRLIDNVASKAKIKQRYMAALFIKAWNYWSAGIKLKSLRFREEGDCPERFPDVSAGAYPINNRNQT